MLSVIIPFYNAAATLERTVRSLLAIGAGHRARLQVIGVDDGSTDGSKEIFLQAARDIEVTSVLLCQENGGTAAARNIALREIKSGWVLFLDADDELIADPFPLLDEHRDRTALLFATEIYRDGSRIKTERPTDPTGRLLRLVTARNPFPILAVVFRAEARENLFDEELPFLEDWHFWAVNPLIFAKCTVFPATVLGRVHASARGKSADQIRNGQCRRLAAERIGRFWGARLGRVERNNLAIQQAIGSVQAEGMTDFRVMARIPASADLYLKWIVYAFFFPFYRRLNRYGTAWNV